MILLDEIISLDASEQTLCRVLAALRNGVNSVYGTYSPKIGNRGEYEIDLDGISGELAYAKMRNLCPDFGIGPRSGGHDFVDRDNRSIDVKTAPKSYHNLVVNVKKKNRPSDVYALMTGEFPDYVYRGEITKEELFTEDHLTDKLINGLPSYVVGQEELTP